MKQLFTILLICILTLVKLNAQNHDSLKQALVKSKSLFSSYQTQTYNPESDCVGAIPICTDTLISTIQYTGYGYYNDIDSSQCCLAAGERNGSWYKIFVTQAGYFAFNVIPNDSLNDDYDWTIFNLTNSSCNELYGNASLLVSCSFSGHEGSTGAYLDSASTSLEHTNDKLKIPVLENEIYYLLITFFADNSFDPPESINPTHQSGYLVNFSYSTFPIDSCMDQTITGIKQDKRKEDVLLYPNPASNSFTMKLNALKTGQSYSMQLFTATGALVHEVGNIKTVENTVDVSTLASGLYYYRVLTTDGKTAAGRFVKE